MAESYRHQVLSSNCGPEIEPNAAPYKLNSVISQLATIKQTFLSSQSGPQLAFVALVQNPLSPQHCR